MTDLIPEPPDSAMVLVGDDPQVLLVRDDHSAREAGYEPGVHWFLAHDGVEPPLSWDQVTGAARDEGRLVADRTKVQRVYTQADVDQAVADGGYEDIGDHRIALGAGRCVVHGEVYSPPELERLRGREAGRG